MISAFANALTGLNAASRSFAGTAHNVAHYGATGPLPANSVAPVAPPGDTGPFRLFDTFNVTAEGGGVKTVRLERDPASVPLYAPQSPVANSDGLVALANVDLESEIVDSIVSSTLFKANLTTFGVADEMLGALLDSKA